MKRIGIMGGTFNPIHLGHLAIAQRAQEQFVLEEVLFIPSGVPYMKDLEEVLPAKNRCEMARLAIRDIPSFRLSMIEVNKSQNTYTFETLQDLKADNPTAEYYFILGADSLWAMEHWKNPEEIFRNCHVLAAVRDDKSPADMNAQIAYLQEKFNAKISLLGIDAMDISSSMIRKRVSDGLSIRGLVPDAVETYIYEHKLYQ